VKAPSAEVKVKAPKVKAPSVEVKVKAPKVKAPSAEVKVKGPKAPSTDVEVKSAGMGCCGGKSKSSKADMKMSGGIGEIKVKGKGPSTDVKVKGPSTDVKVKGPSMDVDVKAKGAAKGPSMDVDVKAKGGAKGPSTDVKAKGGNVSGGAGGKMGGFGSDGAKTDVDVDGGVGCCGGKSRGGKADMKIGGGIDVDIDISADTGIPKGCTDFGVVGGKLIQVHEEGQWRLAGDSKVGFGFELTQDKDKQEGHLLCRVPFTTSGSEIHASLEYVMKPKSCDEGGGQGLCIYLVDPEVAGWDRQFDGSGPLGFVGKAGAIVGVGIDCTGTFCEGKPASIAIKRASDSKLLCDPVPLEGGVVTRPDELWRKVNIKFDIEDNTCDVTIGGVKVLDDIKFEGIKIPKKVCIAVCAGTADGKTNHMCVNKLKLKSQDEDGEKVKKKANIDVKASGIKLNFDDEEVGTGVPKGCHDYGVVEKKLVLLEEEGDWRMAGTGKLGFGFELTQDEDNQEGHLLCRVPFTTSGNELHASFEYVMEPKSCDEGGGQGLCIYLVDPSVEGWDRHFDGTGPLGFVGKKGAIVGVGIDCTGVFCEGQPASIAIKRASDCTLLCDPVPLEGGVVTRKDELWRKVKVKFDIEDNKCDVTIGGKKVLDDIKFEGVKIPKTVCIGVCAGTADGKTNKMCVNKLKLKEEDDD